MASKNNYTTFLSRVRKVGGHWEWHGRYKRGVPVFNVNNKTISAKWYSFEQNVGAIVLNSVTVISSCGVPCCVNPEHLELVNKIEDARKEYNNRLVYTYDCIKCNRLVMSRKKHLTPTICESCKRGIK